MDDSIQIKELGDQDLTRNGELLNFYNSGFPHSQWDMEKLGSFFDKKNKGVCLIAEAEMGIKGFLAGKISKNDKSCMNLSALLVDDELRGKGIARKMVKIFVEKAFQDPYFNRVELNFRGSKKLHTFYEKLGFDNLKVIGTYKNGDQKHHMELFKNSSM